MTSYHSHAARLNYPISPTRAGGSQKPRSGLRASSCEVINREADNRGIDVNGLAVIDRRVARMRRKERGCGADRAVRLEDVPEFASRITPELGRRRSSVTLLIHTWKVGRRGETREEGCSRGL